MQILTTITIVFALFCSTVTFAHDCSSPFIQNKEECENLKRWAPENFSDPKTIQAGEHYRFIVHALSFYYEDSVDDCHSWACKYLDDLSLISNSPKISASLISEKLGSTWKGYPLAFILSIPINLIAGNNTRDMGSGYGKDYGSPFTLKQNSKKWHISSPDDILQNTQAQEPNEIVIEGASKNESVKIIGLLIQCESDPENFHTEKLTDEDFKRQLTECYSGSLYGPFAIDQIFKVRKKIPILFIKRKNRN